MRTTGRQMLLVTILGWGVALLLFFPILWMVLTSFKTEAPAIEVPPRLLFTPTLESYAEVQARAGYLHFALKSVIVSGGGQGLGRGFPLPAALAMALPSAKATALALPWVLFTKMLPSVGVLVPIYLLFRTL